MNRIDVGDVVKFLSWVGPTIKMGVVEKTINDELLVKFDGYKKPMKVLSKHVEPVFIAGKRLVAKQ
jgi:hypothetical protein